jgi:hypothetical protein
MTYRAQYDRTPLDGGPRSEGSVRPRLTSWMYARMMMWREPMVYSG